jgi:hypothetical protein
MSDTSQGPDWWLASDGKWYPPTSPPGWSPHRRPPPSRSLGTWLQVTWAVTGVLGAATALTALPARDAASAWVDGGTTALARDWDDLNVGATGALNLLAVATFIALILSVIWMWGAHKHQDDLEPEGRRWGAVWTIAGWFLPLANYFVPKLVLNEIERIAATPDDGEPLGATWRTTKLSVVGRVFWVGWIVGTLGVGVSSLLWDGLIDLSELGEIDSSAVLDAYAWRVVGGVGLLVAGVAGALHFRRLSALVQSGA